MALWGMQWSYYRGDAYALWAQRAPVRRRWKVQLLWRKPPTSINRGAKEVCLLGLPWLDLRSSGTGCMITKVSAQLRGERGPGYLRRPLSFPLYSFSFVINHRNKCTDHKSGGQMQNQRDRDVSSKIKWFIQHVCSQSRGIYDSTVSLQPSNTFRKYWMYWFDYHAGRWHVVSHQWRWARRKMDSCQRLVYFTQAQFWGICTLFSWHLFTCHILTHMSVLLSARDFRL